MNAPDPIARRPGASPEPLRIAVVNNMPDAALATTERQFRNLLKEAAPEQEPTLEFFYMASVPRAAQGAAYVREHYREVSDLAQYAPHGLIVTGTEPRSARLEGEPYWRELTHLVDWARLWTRSTIWSCLAAHAAVLYMDGIERQRLPAKLSGVFACSIAQHHRLLEGLPPVWHTPHSRLNDLPAAALGAAGYTVVSYSPEAGADIFVRDEDSLFVFVQGHPEYDRTALLREYRRDVGRYLNGERDDHPLVPEHYIQADAAAVVEEFKARVLRERDPGLLPQFPQIDAGVTHFWSGSAARLYRNWIGLLSDADDRDSALAAAHGEFRQER